MHLVTANVVWTRRAAWFLVIGFFSGVISTALGLDMFQVFLDASLEQLEELVVSLQESTLLERILLIFQNNLFVCFLLMVTGFALGWFPALILLTNGVLIGAIFYRSIAAGDLLLFLISVLPHAWIEIPALLLAAGFGIKLGWQWLMPSSRGRRLKVLNDTVLECVAIFGLVAVMLLIAAVIEGGVVMGLVG
jgi:stage II sporulation protein M